MGEGVQSDRFSNKKNYNSRLCLHTCLNDPKQSLLVIIAEKKNNNRLEWFINGVQFISVKNKNFFIDLTVTSRRQKSLSSYYDEHGRLSVWIAASAWRASKRVRRTVRGNEFSVIRNSLGSGYKNISFEFRILDIIKCLFIRFNENGPGVCAGPKYTKGLVVTVGVKAAN